MRLFGVLLLLGLTQLVSAQDACRNPNNEAGTCINIRQCAPLLNLLKTQGRSAGDFLRRSLCRYQGSDPVVCCPNERTTPRPTIDGDGPLPKTPFGPLLAPNCGANNYGHYKKVVNGIPAELGAWPWVVVLGYRSKTNANSPRWLCGGTLISSRHILTAGHCVHKRDDLYMVRLGDLDLNDDSDGATPIDIPIEGAVIHPEYSPTKFTNDIALLRLRYDVPFSPLIRPVCLPVTDEARYRNYTRYYPFIAGWGSVYFNGPSSSHLLELQIPVVSEDACERAYRQFKTSVIDNRVICAGYATGGKDACRGDSGGPLMYPIDGNFYIIGIVSYGFRCAEPGIPGVYTRVTSFLNFILSNLV